MHVSHTSTDMHVRGGVEEERQEVDDELHVTSIDMHVRGAPRYFPTAQRPPTSGIASTQRHSSSCPRPRIDTNKFVPQVRH